jgi:hypothetical protein
MQMNETRAAERAAEQPAKAVEGTPRRPGAGRRRRRPGPGGDAGRRVNKPGKATRARMGADQGDAGAAEALQAQQKVGRVLQEYPPAPAGAKAEAR